MLERRVHPFGYEVRMPPGYQPIYIPCVCAQRIDDDAGNPWCKACPF